MFHSFIDEFCFLFSICSCAFSYQGLCSGALALSIHIFWCTASIALRLAGPTWLLPVHFIRASATLRSRAFVLLMLEVSLFPPTLRRQRVLVFIPVAAVCLLPLPWIVDWALKLADLVPVPSNLVRPSACGDSITPLTIMEMEMEKVALG